MNKEQYQQLSILLSLFLSDEKERAYSTPHSEHYFRYVQQVAFEPINTTLELVNTRIKNLEYE